MYVYVPLGDPGYAGPQGERGQKGITSCDAKVISLL